MAVTKNRRDEYPLMSLDVARWRLATVWFSLAAALFVVLIGQSFGNVYEGKLQTAWSWALPNFIPTLALMISVFAADALRSYTAEAPRVREPFYRLSMGLSIFYLLVLLSTLLLQPIILTIRGDSKLTQIDILQMSNFWLAPLQGLVLASLGVLFFRTQAEKAGNHIAATEGVTETPSPAAEELKAGEEPKTGA